MCSAFFKQATAKSFRVPQTMALFELQGIQKPQARRPLLLTTAIVTSMSSRSESIRTSASSRWMSASSDGFGLSNVKGRENPSLVYRHGGRHSVSTASGQNFKTDCLGDWWEDGLRLREALADGGPWGTQRVAWEMVNFTGALRSQLLGGREWKSCSLWTSTCDELRWLHLNQGQCTDEAYFW